MVSRLISAFRAVRQPAEAGAPMNRDLSLGFTHYWGRSLRGVWVVKRKTAKSRLKRTLQTLSDWCRKNLHQPIADQHRTLKQKLQGHYAYSGITGNFPSLQELLEGARKSGDVGYPGAAVMGKSPGPNFSVWRSVTVYQRHACPQPVEQRSAVIR